MNNIISKADYQGHNIFESHLDQSNKKVFMNNLDWGKTTEERNNNLDKFDSLKTDQEKEDFKISLKFPKSEI
jgi:N-acyl-L-homoserine lactone synthetase